MEKLSEKIGGLILRCILMTAGRLARIFGEILMETSLKGVWGDFGRVCEVSKSLDKGLGLWSEKCLSLNL